MNPLTVSIARLIPAAGWVYIVYGLCRFPKQRWAKALWWVEVVLSVGAHLAQVPSANKKLEPLGYSRFEIGAKTLLFGATWWRTTDAKPAATRS
jgi:hypothetical protein